MVIPVPLNSFNFASVAIPVPIYLRYSRDAAIPVFSYKLGSVAIPKGVCGYTGFHLLLSVYISTPLRVQCNDMIKKIN